MRLLFSVLASEHCPKNLSIIVFLERTGVGALYNCPKSEQTYHVTTQPLFIPKKKEISIDLHCCCCCCLLPPTITITITITITHTFSLYPSGLSLPPYQQKRKTNPNPNPNPNQFISPHQPSILEAILEAIINAILEAIIDPHHPFQRKKRNPSSTREKHTHSLTLSFSHRYQF